MPTVDPRVTPHKPQKTPTEPSQKPPKPETRKPQSPDTFSATRKGVASRGFLGFRGFGSAQSGFLAKPKNPDWRHLSGPGFLAKKVSPVGGFGKPRKPRLATPFCQKVSGVWGFWQNPKNPDWRHLLGDTKRCRQSGVLGGGFWGVSLGSVLTPDWVTQSGPD